VAPPGRARIEADLVTVMFGYNEKATAPEERDVRTKAFTANLVLYLEEVAGVMKRPPACVVLRHDPRERQALGDPRLLRGGVRGLGKSIRISPSRTSTDTSNGWVSTGSRH